MNAPRRIPWARAGDFVQIRTEAEILATLDPSGRLEGLSFMPEMRAYCGTTLPVFRRAEKTCVSHLGISRMKDAVLLSGARCDGSAHGNCDAGCLFFWKDQWVKPLPRGNGHPTGRERLSLEGGADTPLAVQREHDGTAAEQGAPATETFSCQATDLLTATTPLAPWDPRQYVRDVSSGNFAVAHVAPVLASRLAGRARRTSRRAIARMRSRAGAEEAQTASLPGAADPGIAATPERSARGIPSEIQPGDRVMVRSQTEIEATLDSRGMNRGLAFRSEMLLYCGREFHVVKRVNRIIDERSGRMLHLRDCLVLDGIVCEASYHRFCPRAAYLYWREAWLVKLSSSLDTGASET